MLGKNAIKYGLKFCCEDIRNIENYEEAVTSEKRYCCHHKLGIDVSKKELIEKGLYYDRPANELIFMEIGAHRRLHMQNLREETRKKVSESLKGEKNGMYGKHLSPETKQKLSNALKGENHPMYGKHHTDETKQKLSDAKKGVKNPSAKQCSINGITYGCLKDAYEDIKPNIGYCMFARKYNKGDLN